MIKDLGVYSLLMLHQACKCNNFSFYLLNAAFIQLYVYYVKLIENNLDITTHENLFLNAPTKAAKTGQESQFYADIFFYENYLVTDLCVLPAPVG